MPWEYLVQGLAVGTEDPNVTAEETEEEHPMSLEYVGPSRQSSKGHGY